MAEPLQLTVVTSEGIALDVTGVSSVRLMLKGDVGLSLYPGHAPIIAEFLPGAIVYYVNEQEDMVHLPAGIMQLRNNHCKLFVNSIIRADNSEDLVSASEFDDFASILMKTLGDSNNHDSNHKVEDIS
jgi:F0F1-type ATP synthase epsilon subunit